jgi:hypothetical protein
MGLNHSPSIVTNGLTLYLDAGNPKSYSGSGTAWNDLSGQRKNYTWSGTPSFTSDGALSYFTTFGLQASGPASNSFGVTNATGYCVMVACLNLGINASVAFNWDGAGGRGIYSHLPYNDDIVYWDQGGCCAADTRTSVASGGATTWNIWSFNRQSSTNRSIYKNGTILTTNTTIAADPALNSNAAIINVSGGWSVRLSFMMLYNRGLTDLEVQQNFNALRGRYGL